MPREAALQPGPAVVVALALAFALALPRGTLAGDSGQTDTEIRYLLDFVARSGCMFTRNGTTYDPTGAADHLRLKLRRGGQYVSTADEFIDRLASESSWSGKPYTVECDGTVESSRDWLHRALDDYRRDAARGAAGLQPSRPEP